MFLAFVTLFSCLLCHVSAQASQDPPGDDYTWYFPHALSFGTVRLTCSSIALRANPAVSAVAAMAEYAVLVLPSVVLVIARLHATRSQNVILVGGLHGRPKKIAP